MKKHSLSFVVYMRGKVREIPDRFHFLFYTLPTRKRIYPLSFQWLVTQSPPRYSFQFLLIKLSTVGKVLTFHHWWKSLDTLCVETVSVHFTQMASDKDIDYEGPFYPNGIYDFCAFCYDRSEKYWKWCELKILYYIWYPGENEFLSVMFCMRGKYVSVCGTYYCTYIN